jgi:hypothetical protein
MRSLVAVPVLLLTLLGGCGGDDTKGSENEPADSSSSPSSTEPAPTGEPTEESSEPAVESSEPVEDSSAPAGEASEPATGERTDPCKLLTKQIAAAALGVRVGPPASTPGEGNETCSYSAADGTANVLVLLTTYEASGEAALDAAMIAFPDASPVPDLGDAAFVSGKGHAIGVAVDDLVFGMSLLRADSFSIEPAESEAQLIAVAQAVVDAR